MGTYSGSYLEISILLPRVSLGLINMIAVIPMIVQHGKGDFVDAIKIPSQLIWVNMVSSGELIIISAGQF